MEYFCFEGDGLWASPDEDLIRARLDGAASSSGSARDADVVDGSVIRMPKAYPIYDATYREHLDVVRSIIDPIPNLHTVGRNGMHKYNNQDHSMLTAMMTVWNMQGASHDIWDVNTDFEYHEEQKLERSPVWRQSRRRETGMRIGIDATCWANGRGYGRFTRELLPAMAAHAPSDNFVCFRGCPRRRTVRPGAPERPGRPGGSGRVADRRRRRRRTASRRRHAAPDARRRPGALDVFFSPSIYTYFPLPPQTAGGRHRARRDRRAVSRAHAPVSAGSRVLAREGGARPAGRLG